MNRIVCNAIDFVFRDEIDRMNPGEDPVLKSGKNWKKINSTEKPIYQSSIKQNDAGPTNEETVSTKARRNNLMELLRDYWGFHTVLRMSTDEKIFYVGSLEYPCTLEYTSDKVFDNYSFKAVSPA
ncbi:hypothetical protein FACS189451_10970 [Bacteroidia bacterium]|nr:hypothetical protein FACS189451_10970 [Bacteroidia bacterium]